MEALLHILPVRVREKPDYERRLEEARRRIAARDAADVDLLALALEEDVPIWSNDPDFAGPAVLEAVRVFTTVDLLRMGNR